MSARQDVFTYLDKKPKAPLNEVLGEFSSMKESTIRRYFFEYQKIGGKKEKAKKKPVASKKAESKVRKAVSPRKQTKNNIKQQVSEYMQNAPDTKLMDLAKVFPKSQKTTIGNYRRQWLKENSVSKQTLSKSKKNEILSYLDNNVGSNINDLKKVFPEVANKLVTVFRSWKNSQAVNAKPSKDQTAKGPKAPRTKPSKTKEITKTAQTWLEKHKDTIARQKEIIEKQKNRIEALKSQLPTIRKNRFVDTIKKFIVEKLSKN